MKVKMKLLTDEAIIPRHGTNGAACMDIFYKPGIQEKDWIYSGASGEHTTVIKTGLSFEIPKNHVMLIFSRSGHGFNHGCVLANGTGVIDSDYRGEVQVKLVSALPFEIKPEGAIAQFLVIPVPGLELQISDELSNTERNTKGFGSTDG